MLAAMGCYAQTQPGSSCRNPLTLGREYSDSITQPGAVWYVGNTFDLPLTMRFYPHNNEDAPPTIKMDFSCTPGVYEDSIICSIFCHPTSAYMTLPHTATPDRKVDGSQVYYEIAMGEFYLNKLLQAGISYNVQVFVEVTYHGCGRITLTPDAEFSQCMETDNWLLLGHKAQVEANDTETYFVAPYTNWVNDSIRYIWIGTAPATITVGTTCDYDPLDVMDAHRVDAMQMKANDTVKQSNELIQEYMAYMHNASNTAKGGMFYVKAVSAEPGILKVERIPMIAPEGGAIALEYNTTDTLTGNDSTTVYAMPMTWTGNTRFDTPTDHVFTMHVGLAPDFKTSNAIAMYAFKKNGEGHWLGLLEEEMAALWAQTTENYLYVRFACTANTTITPTIWVPSDCIESTIALDKNAEVKVSSAKTIYRLYLNDWIGGDMSIRWDKTAQCKVLFSGICTIGTNGNDDSLLDYCELDGTQKTYQITAADMAYWEYETEEDGYIYVRFYSKEEGGTAVLTSTAPQETDPIPCLINSNEETLLVPAKRFENGQVIIIRGGERYSILGIKEK
jgi:hypothetical protein